MSTEQQIRTARLKACNDAPYLTVALYAMQLVPMPNWYEKSEGSLLMGCDQRWRLYYATDVEWDITDLAVVLVHEVWHLLRLHPQRRGMRHPLKWNVATDLAINDDLPLEKIEVLYKGKKVCLTPCTPKLFGLKAGLIEEAYYDLLPDGGDEEGDEGENEGPKSVLSGRCGSAATGVKEDYEQGESAGEGIGEAEGGIIRREVAEAIKGRGNAPDWAERWAGGVLTPSKIPWQQELAGAMRTAVAWKQGAVDYTHSRISRRQAGSAFLLPALRAPCPEVGFIFDTSGSMSAGELRAGKSELHAILRSLGYPVKAFSADTEINWKGYAQTVNQVQLKGGGGTDMARAIEDACKAKPKPDVLVVLTDCETGWPKGPPPGVKVIVVKVGKSQATAPSWARLVEVS